MITNLKIIPINAQSIDITILKSELDNLQAKYNQFDADLINLKELLKNELINNERNKSDWLKPVKAGISNDKENDTFIKTYASFQSLKNQKDKFAQLKTELENAKAQANKDSITFPMFSQSIEELAIIINPLNDGKLSPEELCNLQKTLGIIDTFNLTEIYEDNKPNSCGYFLAVTHAEIDNKLNKEVQQLKQDINKFKEILDLYSDDNISESELSKNDGHDYNWVILTVFLLLLFTVILIVVLWKIMKPKSYANTEADTETLDNYLTEKHSNNHKVEPRKKSITKSVKNLTKSKIESEHKKNNLFTNTDPKPALLSNLTDSENAISKKLESSLTNPQFTDNSSFSQPIKLILKLTEETIDLAWKGNKDKVEFEPDKNGEYLVIKTNQDEYCLYFNQEKRIRPEVLMTCKKAGIFKIDGNVQYAKIEYIKPAKVQQISSEIWRLVQSGEVFFS